MILKELIAEFKKFKGKSKIVFQTGQTFTDQVSFEAEPNSLYINRHDYYKRLWTVKEAIRFLKSFDLESKVRYYPQYFHKEDLFKIVELQGDYPVICIQLTSSSFSQR